MSEHDDWAEINRLEAENARLRAELAAERENYSQHIREAVHIADALRTQLAEANEVVAEAVQWLRVSDLPCEMTIFRADSILEKIKEGETP